MEVVERNMRTTMKKRRESDREREREGQSERGNLKADGCVKKTFSSM